ncbi:GlcG/HbpS family heme-binding protein [Rouxiella badensis]|jgi:glc operon protein GlcG|uniref:Heme-binding protein n=1 Tax=Rouxiella badensis TaxID=1646377 RepID=A0A1X0WAA4_9GAMM|nr:heme-binding protein [Rouxiella badensis]MCC3704308.1 heme-binding protein [Rouxiella badensis]MCC3720793.1 heme-binding protein [Rouxiella badensis]MCC3730632.1 heme-binding protein [Rouxiella badensis]MCC3734873.1 heme-binding protein [Rouxiella badensis]MCC3741870.1 heme-binding protein [Rouxiella badensis]
MKKLLLLAALCSMGSMTAFTANATLTQTILSYSDAEKLLTVATDKANSLHANVCIAILDQAGQLLAFKRMDNAPVGCIDSSILKARAGALYHTPTDKYMGRANGSEPAIATLPGMVPLGGGNPIVFNNNVIGSVGVSGSANPNEIAIAQTTADSLK